MPPAPKPAKRLKKKPKKIRPVRKRFEEGKEASKRMRLQIWMEQNGNCARCGRFMYVIENMDVMHLKPLQMGRSRNNVKNSLNRRENKIGGDRLCHIEFDSMPPEARAVEAERIRWRT